MVETIFVFLYGLGAILGLPISLFWATASWRRYRELIVSRWWFDRYLVITLSFTSIATGVTTIHVARTIGFWTFGMTQVFASWLGVPIAAGLVAMLLGFLGMIWLADLEVHPPHWRWTRWSIIASVAWFGIMLTLQLVLGW